MMAVVRDGLGHVPDRIAVQPQTPAQVHILVVREEILVESADIPKEVAPDSKRASVGEQRRARPVVPIGVVALAEAKLRPAAFPIHGRSCEVDVPALPVEHFSAGGSESGIVNERLDHSPSPGGIRAHVVVDEAEKLAGGRVGPRVAPAGESGVRSERLHSHPGEALPQEFD